MAEFTGLNMQFDVDAKREATEEEAAKVATKQEDEDWTDNEVEEDWNNGLEQMDPEHEAILAFFKSPWKLHDAACNLEVGNEAILRHITNISVKRSAMEESGCLAARR
jgi:hypothetical protein